MRLLIHDWEIMFALVTPSWVTRYTAEKTCSMKLYRGGFEWPRK